MLAPSYLPSVGINKLVYDRVYGSDKALNLSQSSSDGDANTPEKSCDPHRRGSTHKHSRHHKKPHRHAISDQMARLREEALMHLSTHSDTCVDTSTTSALQNKGDVLVRPKSFPHNMEIGSSHDQYKSPDHSPRAEKELEGSIVLSGEYSVRYLLDQ